MVFLVRVDAAEEGTEPPVRAEVTALFPLAEEMSADLPWDEGTGLTTLLAAGSEPASLLGGVRLSSGCIYRHDPSFADNDINVLVKSASGNSGEDHITVIMTCFNYGVG